MAKQQMKRDTLPQLNIKANRMPGPQSILNTGATVPTRKIDSVRKANPKVGGMIGKPYKGSGGMDTYGPDASDKIRAVIKTKPKK